MSSIVSLHNKKLLRPRNTEYGCNCRMREKCPLQNQCLTLNLNRADVENNADKGTKIYFGLAETSFKAQFANHDNILYIYICSLCGVYIWGYSASWNLKSWTWSCHVWCFSETVFITLFNISIYHMVTLNTTLIIVPGPHGKWWIAKQLRETKYQQNEESIFYPTLPVIKHKTNDEAQYRQELFLFELMKTVSLKHHKWHYQVHDVKFQSLQ